jgi:hypothetical protein
MPVMLQLEQFQRLALIFTADSELNFRPLCTIVCKRRKRLIQMRFNLREKQRPEPGFETGARKRHFPVVIKNASKGITGGKSAA